MRRHAERVAHGAEGSALTAAGQDMARRLGREAPRYAVVVSSPLPRAKETATLIAGRLDAVEPALLPDLSQLMQLATIGGYAALLEQERERAIAEEQAAAWARVATAAGDGHALAVTHGGVIELGALVVARVLGVALDGRAFAFCEGVRIRYADGRATSLEVLRV